MRSPFASTEAQRLGDIIAKLEARVQQLEQGRQQSRLSYSSIENNFINAYDAQGIVRQRLGRQEDGTFAVSYQNGTPPPVPADPEVAAGQLSLIVYWNGEFRGGAQKPGDFVRCDVHICRDEDLVEGDFVPSATTLYGSLLTESAVTIPLDTSTYWVRLVAVNTSDVASDPTPMIQGNPAAAYQIAAKAIGAEQLASEIILASKIISGNQAGQHWEMDPTGLRAYNTQGQQTIGQSSETGDAFFLGSIASAETGQRIVFNDMESNPASYGTVAFYGPDGQEYASIHHHESFDANSVGISIESSPADPSGSADRRGYAAVTPDGFTAGAVVDSSGAALSALYSRKDYLSLVAPEMAFDLMSGSNPPNGTHSIKVRNWQWNGAAYVYAGNPLEILPSPVHGEIGIRWTTKDLSMYASPGTLHITNEGDTAYRPVWASAFTVSSDSATKTGVQDPKFSPLHVVLNNPAKVWFRSEDDADDQLHIGPLADQFPEAFRVHSDKGITMLNLGDMVGILWKAVQELASQHGITPDPSKLPNSSNTPVKPTPTKPTPARDEKK
jgi:hypothetical protein